MGLVKEKIPSLDGIRGMAFLFVFIVHILGVKNEWLVYLLGAGKIGVWLFFTLSSFLLTYYFVSQPSRIMIIGEWKNYFIRRFLRIYPLYALVLLIFYLTKIGIGSKKILIKHLLLQDGVLHFWTMPVETRYYLVLPFVALFLVRVLKRNTLSSLLSLIILIIIQQYLYPASKSIANSTNFSQYLSVFCIGSFSAVFHLNIQKIKMSTRFRLWLDLFAFLILCGIILSIPGIRFLLLGVAPSDYLVSKYLELSVAWSFFILFVLNGRGLLRGIFESPVLRFVGNLSYPAYLIHWIFIDLSTRHIKALNFTSISIVFIGTFCSAIILHYLVERPLSKISIVRGLKQDNKQVSVQ